MNVKFQTLNPSYRTPVSVPRKRTAQSGKAQGNYDTVMINGPRTNQSEDAGFARILARTASAQIREGASPERVRELGQQVSEGTYQPDPQKIAGRLLGLN